MFRTSTYQHNTMTNNDNTTITIMIMTTTITENDNNKYIITTVNKLVYREEENI